MSTRDMPIREPSPGDEHPLLNMNWINPEVGCWVVTRGRVTATVAKVFEHGGSYHLAEVVYQVDGRSWVLWRGEYENSSFDRPIVAQISAERVVVQALAVPDYLHPVQFPFDLRRPA